MAGRTQKIVNLVTNLITSPAPTTMQQSGALISLGGTTITVGTYQFVGSLAEGTALLGTAGNNAELLNMLTTYFAQGSSVGVFILELGAAATPSQGVGLLNTWMTDNPGIFYAYETPASWDTFPAPNSPVLTSSSGGTLPATTYYVKTTYINSAGYESLTSQEVSLSVLADFVLDVASPVTASGAVSYNVYVSTTTGKETLQNNSPIAIGTSWTMPTTGLISGASPSLTLSTLVNNYTSPSSTTYFVITTSVTNMLAYGTVNSSNEFSGYKSAILFVPSPNAQSTEFGASALLYAIMSNNPSSANQLAPFQYRYAYGLTPWPTIGQNANINTIINNNGNLIVSGAEGGVSNNIIFGGVAASGDQVSWWYGIDWTQIQMAQAITNSIINGSNSSAPLLYDQTGIDTLEAVAQGVANNAVAFGCALSATVTATPFITYTQQNPSDYAKGIYKGFLATVVGQNGFLTITFYMDVVNFAAS